MSKVLIVAQCHQNESAPCNLAVLTAAAKLSAQIDVLVLSGNEKAAQEIAQYQGVINCFQLAHDRFTHPLAEDCAPVITELSKDYEFILFPATTFGKNIMPRVAGMMGVQPVSDVTEIIDTENFIRPIYAGNAFEQVNYTANHKILSIRPTSFEPQANQSGSGKVQALSINFTPDSRVEFVSLDAPKSERPELTQAKVVVSGGRALKSAENFKIIEQLADKLNAAIGASRAAVDAGFIANDHQVGQTGKIVAPDLYIAIGISGAIQHLAGIKDSKVIVAINKDEDAPIFEVADYGLVGDLFNIVPELINKI